MLKKLFMLMILSVPMFLSAGCGSGGGTSTSGSTSLFETATVTFTKTEVNKDSTIAAKPNSNDSSAANLTVVVTPNPNNLRAASTFTVRDMVFIYTQTQGGANSFTLPYFSSSYSTTLSISPDLASGTVKDKIVDYSFVPSVTSLTQAWIYDVQARFTIIEDNSGKSRSYTVPLGTIRFI